MIEDINSKTTKGLIMKILSENAPLSAKEIHNKLNREHQKQTTYQSTHKTIKELLEKKILKKNNEKEYTLSQDWLKNIAKFGQKKLEKNPVKEIEEKGSVCITFTNFIEFGKYLINEYYANYPNPENKTAVCIWKHAYPATGISQEEHETMKLMFTKTEHLCICKNSTYLDRLTCEYLKNLGKRYVLDTKTSTKNDTHVIGDYILTVYFKPELEEKIHKLYKKIKKSEDFKIQDLFKFTTTPTEIKILITKNPKLADSLREEAKRSMEEAK